MSEMALEDPNAPDATVRLAARGDRAAFTRLVLEHHEAMVRVAFVIVGDREMARDAVQSAWSLAWRRLASLRRADQIRSWLVAIAANEARQSLRRRRRVAVVDISEALDQRGAGDPADAIREVDLERALQRLKPDERVLLGLRFVAGLDSTEIALHIGLSASGVRSRLARLLARLRHDLEPDGDGPRR